MLALWGLDKTIQLANWAARKGRSLRSLRDSDQIWRIWWRICLRGVSGHKAVLSSCFESGIALGHLAILASILVRRAVGWGRQVEIYRLEEDFGLNLSSSVMFSTPSEATIRSTIPSLLLKTRGEWWVVISISGQWKWDWISKLNWALFLLKEGVRE